MAWQDRPYYRDRGGSQGNPFMWLLNGSVSLGQWFGINVRVHASMVILIGLVVLLPGGLGGAKNAVTLGVVLFGIVLLHEFGHCIASRLVGGDPQEILIYPLGGLATANPPHRPWATFITVAGGPFVNVLICIATWAALFFMPGGVGVPWNPLHLLAEQFYVPHYQIAYYLYFIFAISYALLLFNLWPIFPLDGGQMLQSVLWVYIGYYKATYFACVTGMIGAGLMAMVGLAGRQLILLFIAFSGFMTCLNLLRQIKAAGPYGFDDEFNYAASIQGPRTRHKRIGRFAKRRLRKMAQRQEFEQQRIDEILAKVSAHGMHSLTWWEKRTLRKATARQRELEMEMTGRRD